jgi:hypothetical protein
MKFNNKWLLLAVVLTLSALFMIPAGDSNAAIDGGYVGSSACGVCHTTHYSDFSKSGHPYKVRFTKGMDPVLSGGNNTTTITDPLSSILPTPLLTTLSTATLNGLKVDDGSGNLDWSAASYVIGGYGWKARWGMKDTVNPCPGASCKTGYVWTGSGAQFNMLAADTTLDPSGARPDWSAYNSGTDKKYSCAICHNTNGTSSSDAGCTTALGSGRTEPWLSSGLTTTNHGGFYSEWTYSGVQCEACHGPGETHATTAVLPSTNPNPIGQLTVGTEDICAKCHIRSTNTPGFGGECGGDASASIRSNGAQNNGGNSLANQTVQHHEQFNELVGYNDDGAHASLTCSACHNPHKRAHKVTDAIATAIGITDNDQSAQDRSAVVSCESCHPGKDLKYNMGNISCTDCHMAEITKSATAEVGTWGVKGDVKGHIFAIDPAATTMDRTNGNGVHIATNYMTVNFACGKCHDKSMSSYSGAALTQAQAMASAQGIHINLSNQAPIVAHTGGLAVVKGTATTIVDTSTDPEGGALSIFINWGDGNTSTGAGGGTFTHTYALAGLFNIVHSATDTGGLTASEPVFQAKVAAESTITTSVKITVKDSASAPVYGARLYLKKDGKIYTTGYSKADGTWTFTKLNPASVYTVAVYKSGLNFGNGKGKVGTDVAIVATADDLTGAQTITALP